LPGQSWPSQAEGSAGRREKNRGSCPWWFTEARKGKEEDE
jgi:hypothetical protein